MAGNDPRPDYARLDADPKTGDRRHRNWRLLVSLIRRGVIATTERFSQYEADGGQTIDGTAATVVLDTNAVNDNDTLYAFASNELTISRAGTYVVTIAVSVESDDDTGDYAGSFWLERNATEVPGSRMYVG